MAYHPYCATYDIKKELAVITRYNNGGRKEINLVSWNGEPPKLDLRYWEAGHTVVGSGTTMDKAEALAVYKALQKWIANPLTVGGKLAVNWGGFCILKKFGEIYQGIGGWTKQINIVSWNGKTPVFDIRYWAPNNTRAGRGTHLDNQEARAVYEFLGEYLGIGNISAVDQYKKAAAAGDRSAMRKLGDMYRDGDSVKQNYETAYEWYKVYALAGKDTGALLSLARQVRQWRKGQKLDYAKGTEMFVECCRLAAGYGDATGMYWLGECYSCGEGVKKDAHKAREYYKKAAAGYDKKADAGDMDAMYALGTMYYSGKGVDVDKKKAFTLYEQVVLTSEDPDKDSGIRKTVFKKYRMEAAAGNTRALGKLGDMYYFGWGTDVDYEEAIRWYEAAGKEGRYAFYKIGDMYRSGAGADLNYEKAMEWYKKGADKGEVRAMLALADMYFFGLGVEKDYKKYLEWRKKANKKEIEIVQKKVKNS